MFIYTHLDDITAEEESLLSKTVKLISLNLFREMEKMVTNMQTENKLAINIMNDEIKNIYQILREVYEQKEK